MVNALTIVNKTQKMKPARLGKNWRECPVSDDVIFEATDDCGRTGWFLRLTVSGLYPRRLGPYRSVDLALKVLEAFITEVELELFVNLHNDMDRTQAYVVEGIPLLRGDTPSKDGAQ